jgi:hypothetical protein
MERLVNVILGRIINVVMAALFAAMVWRSIRLLNRVPTGPFLALPPSHSALGRSLTVAPLLAGTLGLVVLASRSFGTWLLLPAIILLTLISTGCGRAFSTLWWPAALGACLFFVAQGLATLPMLIPWAVTIEAGSAPALGLVFGAGAMFATSLWSSAVMLMATSETG